MGSVMPKIRKSASASLATKARAAAKRRLHAIRNLLYTAVTFRPEDEWAKACKGFMQKIKNHYLKTRQQRSHVETTSGTILSPQELFTDAQDQDILCHFMRKALRDAEIQDEMVAMEEEEDDVRSWIQATLDTETWEHWKKFKSQFDFGAPPRDEVWPKVQETLANVLEMRLVAGQSKDKRSSAVELLRRNQFLFPRGNFSSADIENMIAPETVLDEDLVFDWLKRKAPKIAVFIKTVRLREVAFGKPYGCPEFEKQFEAAQSKEERDIAVETLLHRGGIPRGMFTTDSAQKELKVTKDGETPIGDRPVFNWLKRYKSEFAEHIKRVLEQEGAIYEATCTSESSDDQNAELLMEHQAERHEGDRRNKNCPACTQPHLRQSSHRGQCAARCIALWESPPVSPQAGKPIICKTSIEVVTDTNVNDEPNAKYRLEFNEIEKLALSNFRAIGPQDKERILNAFHCTPNTHIGPEVVLLVLTMCVAVSRTCEQDILRNVHDSCMKRVTAATHRHLWRSFSLMHPLPMVKDVEVESGDAHTYGLDKLSCDNVCMGLTNCRLTMSCE